MKNDFRQLVDRNLSGLRWDERRRQRVLHALDPKGGTTMKRKITMTLALAAALVMMASVAVAAVMLQYSPAASAKKLATQAMYETYGFDRHTLGLFKSEVVEEEDCVHVWFRSDTYLPVERIGEYDVHIVDGKAEVRWTHDDKEAALWQSGDPESPVWGRKQLQAYLATDPRVRGEWLKPYLATKEPATALPMATPAVPADESEPDTQQQTGDLPLAQAQAYADAALADVFGMTEAEVAGLDHDVDARISEKDGRRVWDLTYGDAEGMYYIQLDAATGEIIDIGMSTGGNG